MGLPTSIPARWGRPAAASAAVVVALSVGGIGPARPAGAAAGCTPVLGTATTTPAQQAAWFATTGHRPKLDVSVLALATVFVEEGAREGVRGDIAFAQSIVETGYFGFSPSVAPGTHNYAGIGATGGGVKGAAFPDARVGVRAQIQHLRAYADPSLRSAADLKAPLVDPRFGFLVPNARTVACWEQFGNGVWAADPSGYGLRVLAVHQRIAAFPDPTPPRPPAPPATAAVAVLPEAAPVADVPVIDVPVDTTPVTAPDPAVESAFTAALPAPTLTRSSAAGGGGAIRTIAVALTGLGLLSVCTTLWWHGRRFATRA